MPLDRSALAALVAPESTAVLTMELQRGVVGDLSTIPELAREASSSRLARSVARVVAAARNAHVMVVHCTAGFAPDGQGTPLNTPLVRAMLRRPGHLLEGTPAVDLLADLGPSPDDLISHRRHGVSPFGGTNLDALLRERSIKTVVATGVSLNLGIPGLAIEAVNLGYSVVVPRDAVCGVPGDYGQTILENMIVLVASITTVDEIIACWV